MTKRCTKCKDIKELELFGKQKDRKDGLSDWCKLCKRSYEYAKRHANMEAYRNKVRARHDRDRTIRKSNDLRRHFDITLDQYQQMVRNQNNLCALCNKPETSRHRRTGNVVNLSVDHCHKTGRIRGLLCNSCNRGMGNLKDSSALCYAAGDYLKSYEDVSLNPATFELS